MASEEAKFAARADRLAGRQGVAGFMPASARAAQPAPTNRYIMPQFVEKTPYGMKTQDAYSRLFEDRIIFLGVQVDDASADDVMAQLLVLESQDPNRDVMMYINSPGGSMTAMTAIYDTMQYIKPDVQTVCLGQAASAAAILLASGTKGKRLMLPNARVLITSRPSTRASARPRRSRFRPRKCCVCVNGWRRPSPSTPARTSRRFAATSKWTLS